MSVIYEQLAGDGLEQIGTTTSRGQLDQIAQHAAAAGWSYSHFLGRLLEPELAARRQRVIDTCLHFSGLPWMKRLSDFDFSFQPSIDRTLVEELATGRFRARAVTSFSKDRLVSAKPTWRSRSGSLARSRASDCCSALDLVLRMKLAFAQNRMPH